ncbi:MAG: hypothetical protein AAFV85_16650 [Cyanobacteria bacterium J06634_6]
MPKPCSQPLSTNPFESYRDPVTGQWKVRYPASTLPVAPSAELAEPLTLKSSAPQNLLPQSDDNKQRSAKRRWKKSTHTQVA